MCFFRTDVCVMVCVKEIAPKTLSLLLCGFRTPPLISVPDLKELLSLNPDDFVSHAGTAVMPYPGTGYYKSIALGMRPFLEILHGPVDTIILHGPSKEYSKVVEAEEKRDDGDEDGDEDGVRDNVRVRDKALYKIKLGIKNNARDENSGQDEIEDGRENGDRDEEGNEDEGVDDLGDDDGNVEEDGWHSKD
ncbi:hypothetical protein Q7C36_012311 [Tachysurus vachellii]|uniref:Uncharacterized protein n=1 Tax=Tachysurus vachellii TaxID=175792 RepID=A0AA88MP93_TACVA|nr:hypothetical protein Q7C36_012311 [Tachysurus vachellii]